MIFWIYDYVTGKNPIGADLVDKTREKIVEVAKKVKNKVEQLVEKVKKFGGGEWEGDKNDQLDVGQRI